MTTTTIEKLTNCADVKAADQDTTPPPYVYTNADVMLCIDVVLEQLGEARTDNQLESFIAFQNRDASRLSVLAAAYTDDAYCACLNYLHSCYNVTVRTPTVLREAMVKASLNSSRNAEADFSRKVASILTGEWSLL